MKICVIGATGGTGKHVVELALAANHDVLVLARTPSKVKLRDNLSVEQGDVLDAASVASAVQGCGAVISAFGPAKGEVLGSIFSTGVANIIAGCDQHGVKRFVYESGLMAGHGEGLGIVSRIGTAIFGLLHKAMRDDTRLAERAIQASSLDWVIVRPPLLVEGPAGGYRHGVAAPVDATKALPHADVAGFLLRCATDPSLVRTVQSIGR